MARVIGNWVAKIWMDLRCLLYRVMSHIPRELSHIFMGHVTHMNGNWEAEIWMDLRCLFIVILGGYGQ